MFVRDEQNSCPDGFNPKLRERTVSNISEKIIKGRPIEFLENDKLLSKNQYGFRPGPGTENALHSYPNSRKQIVKIDDIVGDETEINCGVPRGSVLGPLLFILYTDSICDVKIDGQIVTYVGRSSHKSCTRFKKSNKLFKSQKTDNQLRKNKFHKFFN